MSIEVGMGGVKMHWAGFLKVALDMDECKLCKMHRSDTGNVVCRWIMGKLIASKNLPSYHFQGCKRSTDSFLIKANLFNISLYFNILKKMHSCIK